MGCALNRNSATGMSVNDWKWTNETSVELHGSLVVQNQAFVTWLVVMMTTFFNGKMKVVVNKENDPELGDAN
jgi:hypothetical protein